MTWFTTGIIFVIVWWLVLFVVLPFGAQPLDSIQPGNAPSAPARPHIGLKMAITTAIAIVLTAAMIWFLDSGLVQLRPA
jgi:predicted secreted protein